MAHLVGEQRGCDDCGAELVFTKPCPCPETDPKKHMLMCCGKDMRVLAADQSTTAHPTTPCPQPAPQ